MFLVGLLSIKIRKMKDYIMVYKLILTVLWLAFTSSVVLKATANGHSENAQIVGDHSDAASSIKAIPETPATPVPTIEVSLQELGVIFRKALEDVDKLDSDMFEDQRLYAKVKALLARRKSTLEAVIKKEAPDLYAEIMYEYGAPRRKLIIALSIGGVALLGTGLALCSYNGTGWEKPKISNAKANLTHAWARVAEFIERASTPAEDAPPPPVRGA